VAGLPVIQRAFESLLRIPERHSEELVVDVRVDGS
jgi:hypothetical protein